MNDRVQLYDDIVPKTAGLHYCIHPCIVKIFQSHVELCCGYPTDRKLPETMHWCAALRAHSTYASRLITATCAYILNAGEVGTNKDGVRLHYKDSIFDRITPEFMCGAAGLLSANSRGPGGPAGPLRTPSRTPWTLSK
jgi:hypothetical protein